MELRIIRSSVVNWFWKEFFLSVINDTLCCLQVSQGGNYEAKKYFICKSLSSSSVISHKYVLIFPGFRTAVCDRFDCWNIYGIFNFSSFQKINHSHFKVSHQTHTYLFQINHFSFKVFFCPVAGQINVKDTIKVTQVNSAKEKLSET